MKRIKRSALTAYRARMQDMLLMAAAVLVLNSCSKETDPQLEQVVGLHVVWESNIDGDARSASPKKGIVIEKDGSNDYTLYYVSFNNGIIANSIPIAITKEGNNSNRYGAYTDSENHLSGTMIEFEVRDSAIVGKMFEKFMPIFIDTIEKTNSNQHNLLNHRLLLAASSNNAESVLLFLTEGANINTRSLTGNSPMMYAAFHNNIELLNELLKQSASIDAQNNAGNSALLIADIAGNDESAEILLQHHASQELKNEENENYKSRLAEYASFEEKIPLQVKKAAASELRKNNTTIKRYRAWERIFSEHSVYGGSYEYFILILKDGKGEVKKFPFFASQPKGDWTYELTDINSLPAGIKEKFLYY